MIKIKHILFLAFLTLFACSPKLQKQKESNIDDLKKIGKYNILIGGVHDHWARTAQDNPALFMAALDYYHYDFTCLMDGDSIFDPMTKKGIENYSANKKVFLGKEQFYGWGHVVTVRNHPKNVNNTNPDFREEIAKLKAGGGFVVMAHPETHPESNRLIFKTGEIDTMLRLGIIDAWQPELEKGEIELIRKTDSLGKTVPIVSGWDVHYVADLPDLPTILYTDKQTPNGHLDSGGRYRTIIIDAKNDFDSIVAAVKTGRSVIEDLRPGPNKGKLYGEKKWIEYLLNNGYRKNINKLDSIRNTKTLKLDKDIVKVGQSLKMTFSEPCTVKIPGTLTEPVVRKTDKNGILTIDEMPALLDRDKTFYPVVALYNDGFEKDFAITLHHKYSFDVFPKYADNKYYLRVKITSAIKGTCSAIVENQKLKPKEFKGNEVLLDITNLDIDFEKAVNFKVKIKDDKGITREYSSYVNYTTAPYFKGSWDQIPVVKINSAEQEILPGYGTTRPFPGEDVISAEIQYAWNEDYFMMRAKVTDSINFNPFITSKSYQGDVIQLGIDPMLRRKRSLSYNHSFNLSLSPKGPLLWKWKSAEAETEGRKLPVKQDFSLGDKYLKISKWEKGIIYNLKIPWSELAPAKPKPGKQIGIYFLLANNDGDGFLDMFGWPATPENGGYLKPNTWGFLTLTK